MSFDWSQATVGHFVDLQRGNTYQSELLGKPGPFLLGLGSIERDGGFRAEKLRTYGGDSPSKMLVYPGDIYVSLKDVTQSGDLLGSVARVTNEISVGRMTQDTVKLVFKNDVIDRSYLYWILRTPDYREYCRSRAMGTTNLSLSREDFLSFPIPFPTAFRLDIKNVLDQIEKKIFLIRLNCSALESVAQAIFKSWFVDFDPVKAKIVALQEGRDPLRAAMSAISGKSDGDLDALADEYLQELSRIAACFPSELVESTGLEIPVGWHFKSSDDISDVGIGKTPPRKEPEWFTEGVGDWPWVSIRDMAGDAVFQQKTSEFLTREAVARHNVKTVPDRTVLLSFKLTIGRVAITDGPMVTNEAIAHFKLGDDAPITAEYLYLYLKQFDFSVLGSTSSIADAVNSRTIREMPILVPSKEVLAAFQAKVLPLFDEIKNRQKQSAALREIRDALLPRLLSGEVEVPA